MEHSRGCCNFAIPASTTKLAPPAASLAAACGKRSVRFPASLVPDKGAADSKKVKHGSRMNYVSFSSFRSLTA